MQPLATWRHQGQCGLHKTLSQKILRKENPSVMVSPPWFLSCVFSSFCPKKGGAGVCVLQLGAEREQGLDTWHLLQDPLPGDSWGSTPPPGHPPLAPLSNASSGHPKFHLHAECPLSSFPDLFPLDFKSPTLSCAVLCPLRLRTAA